MPTPDHPDAPPPRRSFSPLAGLLSYLVPGLGQIYQGRVGKGILFLFCLYSMFFYGMYMGKWSNVYLLDETNLPRIILLNKPFDPNRAPLVELKGPLAAVGHRPQFAGQFWIGIAAWPALWQYKHYKPDENADKVFGTFQRTPRESELNDLQRSADKMWDLAWVYTVIAGVLNVLVIYDAFAGPAFVVASASERSRSEEAVAA